MRLYMVHKTYEAGVSAGFEYFATRREAVRDIKIWTDMHIGEDVDATIRVVNVPVTRIGILRALKLYASHPDNG